MATPRFRVLSDDELTLRFDTKAKCSRRVHVLVVKYLERSIRWFARRIPNEEVSVKVLLSGRPLEMDTHYT